jgi:predicted kinase
VKAAVLVNGVPASGKSTVARTISAATGWPVLALDTVKDALFAEIGRGDREHSRTLGRASYRAIFALVGDFPPDAKVIIDAWFGFQPREVLAAHIARAGLRRVAEVWCHAPPETIGARYAARVGERDAGHLGLSYVPELIALARRATTLGGFPLQRVDTTQPTPDLKSWIAAALSRKA